MTTDTLDRAESLINELWEVGIRPTSLESKFTWLLMCAFDTWVEAGRYAERSYADLLFHEWEPGKDRNFAHFIQQVLTDAYREHPEIPISRDQLTQALIIQAAINCDPPERVIALLAEEADFRARYRDGDEDDDPAEPLLCADEWRRMFATKGWCPSELPDPNGWSERDIATDRCRACGKLRGEGEVTDPQINEHGGRRFDDPCIRDLPGVHGACCGHGHSGRFVYVDGAPSGPAAARRMRELGGNPPEAAFLEETPAA